MSISVYTDGGSRGNPGPSAIGVVIYDNEKSELLTHKAYIGITTNNDAEYQAVAKALTLLIEQHHTLSPSRVDFFCDSELVVKQLNGLYKVKNAKIAEHILAIRHSERQFGVPVFYHAIAREKNKRADALVNEALDEVLVARR